jgi:hypothetical protein
LRSNVDETNANGETALHLVAKMKSAASVLLLCDELGANVCATNNVGETPLHVAAKRGATSTIRVLVALGADVGAKDGEGKTPLHVAAENDATQEAANDGDAASEADSNLADYVASKPVDDSETDVWEASVEKTRLASAVESVGAEVSGEDEAALATRLQDEMKKRGVGAPRIERWGGRFWRASGFATTDDGVATFCEAVDVDPTSAQRTALEKFDAARF